MPLECDFSWLCRIPSYTSTVSYFTNLLLWSWEDFCRKLFPTLIIKKIYMLLSSQQPYASAPICRLHVLYPLAPRCSQHFLSSQASIFPGFIWEMLFRRFFLVIKTPYLNSKQTPHGWRCGIYVYNGILAVKKNEIMPFAGAWMDLEIIILREVSQKEKDKYMISLICGI